MVQLSDSNLDNVLR